MFNDLMITDFTYVHTVDRGQSSVHLYIMIFFVMIVILYGDTDG